MISIGSAITAGISAVGGFIVYLLGGWDIWLQFLVIMMFVDIITGVMKSAYKKSDKSNSGAFNSAVFMRGLLKKGACLFVIVIAVEVDMIFLEMGTPIEIALVGSVRNAVILFFWLGEVMSILENVGEMGISIPKPLKKFLDVLNDTIQDEDEKEDSSSSDTGTKSS